MQYAPIALFTYNRPDKTQRVLESLLQNAEAKDSDLFIFSDGPKNEKAFEGVRANREYLHSFKASLCLRKDWGGSVTLIEREKNWGLANSLIAGITEVINKYGRVIVVEDDLILSPYFLKFMNDALIMYENEDKVCAISAFVPAEDHVLPETFFLRFFHCWGWATWKRGIDLFNADSRYLLRKMRFKKNEFDLGGSLGAYGNLYCQKVGLVDSWWVRMYASFFLADKLTLFPKKSLVLNGGLDGTGTHCESGHKGKIQSIHKEPIRICKIQVEENELAYNAFNSAYAQRITKISKIKVLLGKVKSFIRRLFFIDCM